MAYSCNLQIRMKVLLMVVLAVCGAGVEVSAELLVFLEKSIMFCE